MEPSSAESGYGADVESVNAVPDVEGEALMKCLV